MNKKLGILITALTLFTTTHVMAEKTILAGGCFWCMESDFEKLEAVTDVSSGQTLVNLSGSGLAQLLQKSTVYDCHESNFPAGKVVQTTFAKTGTTMCKLEDGSVDLVIRRSFSDYFFLWLADASEEYGLRIT